MAENDTTSQAAESLGFVAQQLSRANPLVLSGWAMFAAYITYFSMYAFRKPYTVAGYDEIVDWGISYKIILIFAQVGGYTLSKLIGIKLISELSAKNRAAMIMGLVGVAHLALLPYAVAPYWLKPICLFFNGLPLGMVFGCVFAYLEGRRVTEALAAGLCASFIMASGNVKSVGDMLLQYWEVPLFWMPFVTGAFFWPTLLLGTWMLAQLPPPNQEDIASRAKRTPFNRSERSAFFKKYAFGFTLLISMIAMLTIFRTIRDDYANEIWEGMGIDEPEIFGKSETLVAFVCVLISAIPVFIRSNYRAFVVALGIVGTSYACATAATLFYWGTEVWTDQKAFFFMVLVGICLYIPYVLFHTTIYERVIAIVRDKSNIGYLMYLGDFAGYLCSIVIMVVFDLGKQFEWSKSALEQMDFVGLLFWLAIIISPLSVFATVAVMFYFHKKKSVQTVKEMEEAALPSAG